jgi:2-haloacid dehalogenase
MLDFTRFEILTFDCYGTLINWEAGILSALHRILSAHDKEFDDATLLKLYGDFELRSEHGVYHPYREVLQSVVRHSALNSDSLPPLQKSAPCQIRCPVGVPGPTR